MPLIQVEIFKNMLNNVDIVIEIPYYHTKLYLLVSRVDIT